jgi:hypothetical protein
MTILATVRVRSATALRCEHGVPVRVLSVVTTEASSRYGFVKPVDGTVEIGGY